MSLVIIQAPPLTAEQKKRIGDRIIASLHGEGVPAASVVVLFQPDRSDIYLDGGLVHELEAAPRPVLETAAREAPPSEEAFKFKMRRNREELEDLRNRLVAALEKQGGLSSFQAQEELGLKECEWAPATLRRLFGDLEQEGLIVKQGQKRGTRYVWTASVPNPTDLPLPRLVKRNPEDPDAIQESE
jgi:hypothetical protein